MNNKKDPVFIIIGYSLDSAIRAREIALKNHKVIYLKTGKLGFPLDDIRDYISYEDILKIKSLHVSPEFEKLHNSTYVFIQYDQLKFVNNRNGLISYPLNKSSFESAEEWEQLEYCITKIDEFREDLKKVTNVVNIYKNFFPKWLYDCLLKHMGINKWGGYRQSKFTKEGLNKEVSLSCLDDTNTGTIYRPKITYEELCNELLDHKNIKIDSINIKELREFVRKRYKNYEIVLMDNRVDYICNYSHGSFDRVKFEAEYLTDPNLEEFMDISNGIVFTPTKDYFLISNEEGKAIKLRSKKIESINNIEQSLICPTINNKKLYNEYKKMMNLYSRKYLDLDNLINTIIK